MGRESGRGGARSVAADRRLDVVAVVLLAFIGGVVPLVVAHHFGALGIPRNDDWSYLLATFRLADSRRLDLNGWAAVNVVGQMLPAVPIVWLFGERITALQIEVAVLGVAGLIAVYRLGCDVVSRREAFFVSLVVAVSPLWAPLTASYMTDIPAFALAMLALVAGVIAVRPARGGSERPDPDRRVRTLPYAVALALGCWAYTVRQNAVVVIIAVTFVAGWIAWQGRREDRRLVAAGLVASVAVLVGFEVVKGRAVGYQTPRTDIDPNFLRGAVGDAIRLLPALGLLIAPALVLAGPRRLVRAAWRLAPRSTVVVVVAMTGMLTVTFRDGLGLGIGNYLDPRGVLGEGVVSGTRPLLLGRVGSLLGLVGVVVVTVAAVGALPPVVVLGRRVRARDFAPPGDPAIVLVALTALGFGAFIVASAALGNAMWDRYLLNVVPLVSLCLVWVGRRWDADSPAMPGARRVAAVGALGLLAIIGLVFSLNSASFDGARWEVASVAARTVDDPGSVEGGFEWDDYHAGREIYLERERDDRRCVVVVVDEHPPSATDRRVVASREVWGPGRSGGWIVARSTGRCGPGAGPSG